VARMEGGDSESEDQSFLAFGILFLCLQWFGTQWRAGVREGNTTHRRGPPKPGWTM